MQLVLKLSDQKQLVTVAYDIDFLFNKINVTPMMMRTAPETSRSLGFKEAFLSRSDNKS